jgi:hypothetical protein
LNAGSALPEDPGGVTPADEQGLGPKGEDSPTLERSGTDAASYLGAATGAKAPPGKIHAKLTHIREAFLSGGGLTPDDLAGFPPVRVDAEHRVQVYIHMSSVGDEEISALEGLGVVLEVTNQSALTVQGWVPLENLKTIGTLSFVRSVSPPSYAVSKRGSVLTEGDSITRSNQLRDLGVIGNDVRVGVISDGANALGTAQLTGDLPGGIAVYGVCSRRAENPASCDPGRTCNEGTAMAEIIHDIAPGAEIAVGAVNTSLEFVARVYDLVTLFGADIVVDDLGFFGEPYFEDGELARAVADVASDVIFVSAAGNYATGHYERDYRPALYEGTELHDFGSAAGSALDTSLDITVRPGEYLVTILQWNDRYGSSSNDYDLFLVNDRETDLLCANCSSAEFQGGFEDPIEGICYHNATSVPVHGKLAISRFSGTNRRVEMFMLGGTANQYNTPDGSVFGHTGLSEVVAVAAINANDAGHDTIAPYSSRGPSRIDYPSLRIRRKPDVTSIDGVRVTGAGGFPRTFYGTSAAAPHAAGIAALLKSVGATNNQVKQALLWNSIDLGPAGRDAIYGYGRADALASFRFFDADLDGVLSSVDNCPDKSNPSQLDFDSDGLGDRCDVDDDNDGVADSRDAFPFDPGESRDTDSDGIGDASDSDDDNDGISDQDERLIYGTNPLRRDSDGDGLPDNDELTLGLDPLNPDDCPEDLCPPSSGTLLRLLPAILERRQESAEQQ